MSSMNYEQRKKSLVGNDIKGTRLCYRAVAGWLRHPSGLCCDFLAVRGASLPRFECAAVPPPFFR